DRRVEPLVLARDPGLLVVELDVHGGGLAAVDDGRHLARTTQAAARTFPLVLAAGGLDGVLVCHFNCSLCLRWPPCGGDAAHPRPGGPCVSVHVQRTDGFPEG